MAKKKMPSDSQARKKLESKVKTAVKRQVATATNKPKAKTKKGGKGGY